MHAYHLPDAMKALPVELERLLKQNPILGGPLVREGCKVGQVQDGSLEVMLVPEQHPQGLLTVVSILFFSDGDIFFHWEGKIKRKIGAQNDDV